ncbi:hypothetical protein ACH4GZ_06445 [Streptomyces hygroscopicus]|uniref:hypothetical protein n=1 Tax=Streptomyces hygroscopicus TaxID=1912 RepID=UPI0021ACAE61|nr:hypothetical protein [Streptomyces hygroscopicus]
MTDMPATALSDSSELPECVHFVDDWDGILHETYGGDADRAVLDCAGRLAADPAGQGAYAWTLGLVMMAAHIGRFSRKDVTAAALEALHTTDRRLREAPCAHRTHPYESDLDDRLDHFVDDLPLLTNGLAEDEDPDWEDDATKEQWLCPRDVAGYARVAVDIIAPGSVGGVPPRLPARDARRAADLRSIVWDYPGAGVDPGQELSGYARDLLADPLGRHRAGLVVVLHAACFYAAGGRIRDRRVLDTMVDALEAVLPGLGDAPCAHGAGNDTGDHTGGHPEVGRDTAEQATVGVHLLSPGGRGVYRHWHREEVETAPLEAWLCPAFLAAIAREALDHLRAGRERLFGVRDTAHLDEVLLRPDGRLDIARLTRAVRFRCRDGQAAEDAGLWAARRFAAGPADPRERLVLLLVACWSVTSDEEPPPEAVRRDLRAILGAVETAGAARPCPHGDAHPWEVLTELMRGRHFGFHEDPYGAHLNHLYAPREYDTPERPFDPEAWSCPRHLAERIRLALRVIESVN